ncbi:ribosome maturation factor RimP [uncultured Cardiobacterium sp.]|uniref:ribosome maturation factor RimP n=1 Tax=uncultured Cardiobacterium sp. TaxID=417619 RepID=UPI0026092E7D|nr:ribosome maturation factor RimP [uncultured Cardiobacterium sp.]
MCFHEGGVVSREEKVTELLRPVVESMGFEWVGVEYHHNSVNSVLRIYVDRPEGGIDMDGVVAVTEAVNPILDVEDPINASYTLEVSSPGLDRPLFTFADFVRFTGQTVKLDLSVALGKRRRFEGVIAATDEAAQRITLQVQNGRETEAVEIDFAHVDKARLVPVF